MNRTINILSTSRTALILLLATLLTATTAWADDHVSCRVVITTPTNGSITVTRNDTHEAVASGTILPQGTTITVTATPDNGFDLKEQRLAIWTYKYTEGIGPLIPAGWIWSSDGGALISNGATYTIEENKEYRFNAKFDQNVVKYSITQNITGSGSLEVTSESVAGNQISVGYTPGDGCELTSFSVTKADNSNVSVNYDKVKDKYFFTMPAANVTVHAVFTANSYTVHFDANANDATGTMANQTIRTGSTEALTTNAFSRTNYVFARWNTASNGSGTAYADGASVTDLALLGETITLYAQWKATYTVHFDANATDATGTIANQTFIVGRSQALTSNGFSRTNYVFAGWNTASDGSGTAYADGASVTDLTTTVGATITLYAQWKTPVNAEYVDADGTQKIMTGCLEITPDNMPTILSGNCYVKESVTYANKVTITGNTTIILANGATMSVGTEAAPLGGDYAIYDSGSNCLTIYGQSLDAATAGRLEVYSTGYAGVKLYSGSYTQHSGNVKVCRSGGSTNNTSIYAGGSVTIDGGTLYASIASEYSQAICASGNISITGGDVTANATGANSYGMLSVGNITLGWTRATDRITATSYLSNLGTVSLSKRFAFDDGGTVTLATTDNIGGKTLRPAALVTFDANGGSDVAAQPVFIGTAATEPTPTRTGYTVGGWKLGSSDYDFATLATGDITLTAQWTPDPAQFSQSGDTYTIHTAGGWNVFCDLLADNTKGYFGGKTVRLGDDITVTRMAGGSGHEFTGTFDGGGHTLTFNYANTDNDTRTAPFSYVDGATIQNLIVGGTISGTAYRAAGIIGETVNTTSHITNCVSSVDISSGRYTGGFSIGGNVEIEGCVFNGKIKGTTFSGGFIGYSYSAQVIKNSLFAPQDGSSISGGTFYYKGGGDVAPVNSYYTQALGTAQGKACHSVTAGDNVTIGAIALTGTATQYTVSGITAYSGGGLQRGQTLYYGSGDQLSLTLSNSATGAPQGYQYGYTASAGNLSGSTLTMPDQDVTISVNTATLAPIDWATVNQGTSDDPYMIYNKDQLLLLAHRVNGTNGETANTYQGKYFKLGADITFDPDADEGDDYAENYEAIGGNIGGTERYFKGNFDGDGHTVSGIRIRKDGNGDADDCQGLFGQTWNADIHDVHLTDARIKGYHLVGGIVGYIDCGTISGCTVTDSYITADNYYGTICGTNNGERLTNNYYHGCTVNGTTVTSGKGCEGADITDNNGALPAYAIALGDGVSTNALASVPENGFVQGGTSYYREGLALPLASTLGSEAPEGYTLFSVNGTALSGNTYTVNATDGDVTISALAPIDWATVNEGTSADPYMIYNKDQLLLLAHRVNGTNGETFNTYEGKYFKLGADITFSHPDNEGDDYAENYEAIGGYYNSTDRYFRGNFDGDGHTVSGIRIRKTGSGGYANYYQGLFGQTGSVAVIHDVHLTDARITGFNLVGGIIGLNIGTVSGCTVTDSHITATGGYGTICGGNASIGTLTNNYYHGCTVNGTAVTSGVGCDGSDITDNNGALPAYAITFGDGVSTNALASVPENGFVQGGTSYYRKGLALPLASTLASEVPEGYTLFSVNGTALSGNTYTVNATDADVTITTAIRSDGLQHEVSYMTADGTTQTAQAIALDGHGTVDSYGDINLDAGTYYVGTDITYANRIYFYGGDVTLILANGKTMTLNGNTEGIFNDGNNLTIYGQSLDAATAGTLSYNGKSVGIIAINYEQHSGNVSITTSYWVSGINANVTLRGGTLTVTANGDKALAIGGNTHSILGGQLTANATGTDATGILASAESGNGTITLGWSKPTDRITASSIRTDDGGTVAVADGQALTDGSGHIYTGTLTAADLAALGGQTLQPCLALAITYNSGSDCVWTTFVAETDCTVPEGLTAYTVGQVTASEAVAEPVDYLPKGVPVLLCRTATATTSYTAVPRTVSEPFSGGNLLSVTTEPTAVADGCAYVLYGDEFVLAAGGTLPAGVVYLPVGSAASSARRLVISHGTTAIADAPIARQTPAGQAPSSAGWYAVDGRRLDGQPTAKGLYIHGGKKVIVK